MNRRRVLSAVAACLVLAGCAVSASRASAAHRDPKVAVVRNVVTSQSGGESAAQTGRLLPQYQRPFAELINALNCPRIDADSESGRCTSQDGTIEIDFGSYAAQLMKRRSATPSWWVFVTGKRDGQRWVADCTCSPSALASLGGRRLR
ncbi:hypothetical protein [uncultured Jatrophihabitans sp.]|uniref:hypothetical protein n=1 Tax=uncultured Jatrophihabitans sp. TaxID=1610747 RepID=UPI0035C9D15B